MKKIEEKRLPTKIKTLLGDEVYKIDEIGKSQSSVLVFSDKVLKIQKNDEEAENEIRMMRWLSGKLPVPEVLAYECDEGKSYLLMTKVTGAMACEEAYMKEPEKLTRLLAQALKELWKVECSDCPADWTLKRKLKAAEYAVVHGLVDMEDTEPDTYGEGGFSGPEELLQWLIANEPEEERVLSHGDVCLPNLFFEEERLAGFIDLGRCGIADKWQDIALCYRSLKHNYEGKYYTKKYEGYRSEMLFEMLGIEPDWKKIRYYILLDELF